jgi:hypothetical protein
MYPKRPADLCQAPTRDVGKETSVAVLARSRIGALAPKAQKYRQRMVGSLIVMAIVGGALIPPLMGKIADASHSMALAYVVPLVAYLFIAGMHRGYASAGGVNARRSNALGVPCADAREYHAARLQLLQSVRKIAGFLLAI